jgi:ACS family tartrate transporter-like MFS transporter
MTGPAEQQTFTKVTRRLIPFAMLLFYISLIDRANISYAALEMNKDLQLSPSIYGLAAGIFFIGYFLFEVPSNLILMRVGARRWLGRIMISWGIVATAMAWVTGPYSLYVMRFLLGLAEAGLFPGLLYYLSFWIPARARGITMSVLMSTTALAYVTGGPLATALMAFEPFGLRGWQFMFVAQGIPAIIVGFIVLFVLTEKPEDATWLTQSEKDHIARTIAAELAAKAKLGATSLREGFLDRRVWIAALFTFLLVCSNFGTVFWLPQILKGLGDLSNMQVGLLSVIPYLIAGIGMILWGRHSDRTGERKWHLVGSAVLAAVGYACAGFAPNPTLSFIAICFAALGIWSMFGIIWAYCGDLLGGAAAASGLALINSIGTLGGFVGPFLIGFVRERTQTFSGGLYVLAGFALVTALVGLLLKNREQSALQMELAPARSG